MKLLSKNELFGIKAEEKRADIDAGLKLARKVDELRETHNKEESNLNKFREQTVNIVSKDVDELILKKNQLDYEVKVLEGRRSLLNEPFDKEWDTIVERKMSDLNQKEASFSLREHDFSQLEKSLQEEARIFFAERNIFRDSLKQAEKDAKEAKEKLETAQNIWNEARLRSAKLNSETDAKDASMKRREIENEAKDRELAIREQAMKEAAKALAQRDKFISDKYKTLMRTEEILKAKNKK